jgi:CheY-like chemotaxis protein
VISALERAPFDVLVSDIAMSGDDGYDPAYVGIEDRADAIAAGSQQHAAKPIQSEDLAAAVTTLAGRAERPRPS